MARYDEIEIVSNSSVPRSKGKTIDDAVTITTGRNQVFNGWKSVSITKSIESLAHGFSVEIFDSFLPLKKDWPLKPGVEIKVQIGKERVLTGYIDALEANYSPGDRGFSVTGRSRPADLVDCSVDGAAEYTNIELFDLATQLVDPFGIKVFLSVVPKKIDKFAIKIGESVFEALDRAARLQGFFWISTRGGNIRLTRAGRGRSVSELSQDFNLKSASVSIDNSKRFSKYTVKGQTSGTEEIFGTTASQPIGVALDRGITRNRPLVVIAEGSVDSSQALTRAQWEAANAVAQGLEVSAIVQGWLQQDGSLWDINQIVRFKSQFLGVNSDLLIKSVTQSKSNEGGTTTSFELIRKDSLDPKPEFEEVDDLLSQLGPNA